VADSPSLLREQARAIWQAAVDAVDPFTLVRDALADPPQDLRAALAGANRVLVVGGGKAGAGMAAGVEAALADWLDRVTGVVNVPAGAVRPLKAVRLHAARPDGSNHPATEGVAGVRDILALVRSAGPQDLCLCLLSGGGSALLPAPTEDLTLAEKQQVTQLLHASGATIGEMNCVRKHLSAVKGGRLAEAFFAAGGRHLFTLAISDVVGDRPDVIASGPTVPDPTTYADALAVLDRYGLTEQTVPAVLDHLNRGLDRRIPDTPKSLPDGARTLVIGNNARALNAAGRMAEQLGYPVLNLGSYIEGETREVAVTLAGIVRSVRADGRPRPAPLCVLSGGETTVALWGNHGRGGRNQEFVLAAALHPGAEGLRNTVILSGGTDGEDGPTDAAGALADEGTLDRAARQGLNGATALAGHDAYPFFAATGDLLVTGLTGTNVMDVRVFLIGAADDSAGTSYQPIAPGL
jgi:hydroxypyruvate reductase/glycerate 2-kinase